MDFIASLKSHDPAKHLRGLVYNIGCRIPFQFTRFSDGELFMLSNKEIQLTPSGAWVDGKQVNGQRYEDHDCKTFFPYTDNKISNMLRESLCSSSSCFVLGLPLPCCAGETMYRDFKLENNIQSTRITTANLLINHNYPYFVTKCLPVLHIRPIIMVANRRADLSYFPSVIKHIKIGDDAKAEIETYLTELMDFLKSLSMYDQQEIIILFAASYFSNILISKLSYTYNHITMIDIGTSLHPQMNLGLIRHYLQLYYLDKESYVYHQCSTKDI